MRPSPGGYGKRRPYVLTEKRRANIVASRKRNAEGKNGTKAGNAEWQALGNKDRPPGPPVRFRLTPLDVFRTVGSETLPDREGISEISWDQKRKASRAARQLASALPETEPVARQ